MGFPAPIRLRSRFSLFTQSLIAILIGTVGVVLILLAMNKELSAISSAVIVFAIPLIITIVINPRIGAMLLIFSMCFIEEFPGGVSEEDSDRSARTLFYELTVGVSAIYIPDIMVLGLMVLYYIHSMVYRTPIPIKLDKIGIALLLILATVMISLMISASSAHPGGAPVLDLRLVGVVELPERVARMIALLQFKLFLLIIPAYVVGLFFFKEERDIKHMLVILAVSMIGTVLQAAIRIGLDPGMIRQMVTVIYDTASVWFLAMTIFFFVGMWACGKYSNSHSVIIAIFSLVMMVLILLSFRRTMWGAIALALVFFPFILPKRSWGKLAMITIIGVCFALLILLATPIGHTILSSVIARLTETSLDNSSTLYRFAIFIYIVRHFTDIPLFGYGVEPLWNEIIRVRFFETSMENIHSIYYWILLRLGPIGTFITTVALALIFMRLKEVHRLMKESEYKILVGVIFLGVIMFLFSGLFNPSYGRVRFMVPLGLMLALVTRLPIIMENKKKDESKT